MSKPEDKQPEVVPEELKGHIYPWMRGKDEFVQLSSRQVPPALRKVLAMHKKGVK